MDLLLATLPQILAEAGTRGLVAIALVGSGARGEETWRDGTLVSDIDLTAVMATVDPMAQARFGKVAARVGHGISIGCSPLYSLARYRTLELYGARRSGRVLWGRPDVYSVVRMIRPSDVPLWEAPRLVLNRVIEFLRADAGLVSPWYAATKMFVALGEADLILTESYDPSYRQQRLLIAAQPTVLGDGRLRELVLAALDLKLGRTESRETMGAAALNRDDIARSVARVLSLYLKRDVGPLEGLRLVSASHRSYPHRLYYMARNAATPGRWRRATTQDPIFWFWGAALEVLTGGPRLSDSDLRTYLRDFAQTNQPLPR